MGKVKIKKYSALLFGSYRKYGVEQLVKDQVYGLVVSSLQSTVYSLQSSLCTPYS